MKVTLHDQSNCKPVFKPYSVLVTVESEDEYHRLVRGVMNPTGQQVIQGIIDANPNK